MDMILVLSFGGSLRRWHEQGLLTREIEVYLAYLRYGIVNRLHIFSYEPGDREFLALVDAEDDLRKRIVLHMPPRALTGFISKLAYSLNPAIIARLRGAGIAIAKTNQISGSWVCFLLRAAGIHIFARCGYILSRRLYKDGHWARAIIAWLIEGALFNMADFVSVTTASAAENVRRRVFTKDKVFFNPTYVNTAIFNADVAGKSREDAIIFVGRLEPAKNLPNLVKACALSGIELHIIGTGKLKAEVEAAAAQSGANVKFLGMMQNNAIAEQFKAYKYYALTSRHEGLPKSLIEALSSEMVCIGTDVPGINDLITDGRTGYLARSTDAQAISEAILRATRAPDNADIARAARQFILERHSLQSYVERELRYFRDFLKVPGVTLPVGIADEPVLARGSPRFNET